MFYLKSSFIQCCVLHITFFLLCDWQLFEDNLNKVFSNAKTHRLDWWIIRNWQIRVTAEILTVIILNLLK